MCRTVALLAVFAALGAAAARADDRPSGPPARTLSPLPGKAIGLVIADGKEQLAREGRTGQANALLFASGFSSYKWFYVPGGRRPQIGGLLVPVGESGATKQRFDSLSIASPLTVKKDLLPGPYSLVEMEVNGGQGSPASEIFVGTKMQVVEGTGDYPLHVSKVIQGLEARYRAWRQTQASEIEAIFAESERLALEGKKPTEKRQSVDRVYATWLPDKKQLLFQIQSESVNRRVRKVTLPAPPQPQDDLARKPPAREIEQGIAYGVELGMSFVVSRHGKIEEEKKYVPQGFRRAVPEPKSRGGARQVAAESKVSR